jgi:hypothetical protein
MIVFVDADQAGPRPVPTQQKKGNAEHRRIMAGCGRLFQMMAITNTDKQIPATSPINTAIRMKALVNEFESARTAFMTPSSPQYTVAKIALLSTLRRLLPNNIS